MKKFIIFVLACLLWPVMSLASIDRLNFTTEPQAVAPGAISTKITIQAQDSGGSSQVVGEKITLNLETTSGTGEFSSSATTWKAVTSLTMNSNWANRTFYYKDSSVGKFTITVSAGGKSWTKAVQEIVIGEGGSNGPGDNPAEDDEEEESDNAGSGDVSDSAHSAQVDISTVKNSPPKVGAGRKRTTAIGTPINFEALTSNKELEGRYTWTWGDGTSSGGKNVSHVYEFPGTYNVVLNATFPEGQAVARTEVVAVDPLVKISEINQRAGYVEITNGGAGEVNINGWTVQKGSTGYKFPLDTIIGGKKGVKIPLSLLKFGTTSEPVYLMYANGKVANAQATNASLGNISTTTVAELQKVLQELAATKAAAKQAPTVASGAPTAQLAVAGAGGGGEDGVTVSPTTSGKTFQPAPASSAPVSANVAEVIVLDKKPGFLSRAVSFVQKLWTR